MSNEGFLQKAGNAEGQLGAAMRGITMGTPEPAVRLTGALTDEIMAVLEDAARRTFRLAACHRPGAIQRGTKPPPRFRQCR
jgi:hypothetical protein